MDRSILTLFEVLTDICTDKPEKEYLNVPLDEHKSAHLFSRVLYFAR